MSRKIQHSITSYSSLSLNQLLKIKKRKIEQLAYARQHHNLQCIKNISTELIMIEDVIRERS